MSWGLLGLCGSVIDLQLKSIIVIGPQHVVMGRYYHNDRRLCRYDPAVIYIILTVNDTRVGDPGSTQYSDSLAS